MLGLVQVVYDQPGADGQFTHGSLGDLGNPVVLNGGYLAGLADKQSAGCLAPQRTIYLGPSGGILDAEHSFCAATLTVYGKITGPGMLTQPTWSGHPLTIDNPDNDYTGGTLVAACIIVTPRGKLGKGPVLVRADNVVLQLEGDANIDPKARLTVSHYGTARFRSAKPVIGSLDGSGFVLLGDRQVTTTLALGGDDTDSTFYGKIRNAYPQSTGSVTKTGRGTLTLYGARSTRAPRRSGPAR